MCDIREWQNLEINELHISLKKKGSKFPNLQFLIRRHVFQSEGSQAGFGLLEEILNGVTSHQFFLVGLGAELAWLQTPRVPYNAALSNTQMFPDSILEGAELANRVTGTAEVVESALKEMDSWHHLTFPSAPGPVCLQISVKLCWTDWLAQGQRCLHFMTS